MPVVQVSCDGRNRMNTLSRLLLCALLWGPIPMAGASGAGPTTRPAAVGEQVPSEDAVVKDLHSMGLLDGRVDIFRCACPVRDLAKRMTTTRPSADALAAAVARMRHLHDDLGVRTDFSFQAPGTTGDEGKPNEQAAAVALERQACDAVGIRFVSRPIANAGPASLQTMTDRQALALIDPIAADIRRAAATGGVVFHCSAGHDRTGLVAAWLRVTAQGWPVDQADAEMRRLGHNWPKYSDNGGLSSWQEARLRGMATLRQPTTAPVTTVDH